MTRFTHLGNVLSSLTFILFLLTPVIAQAAPGAFMVDFQTMPLFSQSSMAPNDSVTRAIAVGNKDTNSESFYMEALNSNTTGLANVLTLTVNNGQTQLYSDTLAHFFTVGRVALGVVAPSATTTYTATVSFISSSGNSYQNASAGFDLCIGILGGDTTCDGSNSGGGGDGGGGGGGNGGSFTPSSGGGGGSISPSLQISNEAGVLVPPTAAAVTWNTNVPATTQVVYGPESQGPYVLDTSAPNFDYPNSTTEDSILTTRHSVSLQGLTPGKTYNFRVVSRLTVGGAPTVSPEYQLAVPGTLALHTFFPTENSTNSSNSSSGGNNKKGNTNLSLGTVGSIGASTTQSSTTSTLANGAGSNDAFAAAAALAGPFSWLNPWFWFFIVFSTFAVIFEALYERVRHRQEYVSTSRRNDRRVRNYALASFIGLVLSVAFNYSYWYDIIPFAITATVFSVWFVWRWYPVKGV